MGENVTNDIAVSSFVKKNNKQNTKQIRSKKEPHKNNGKKYATKQKGLYMKYPGMGRTKKKHVTQE